MRWDHLFDDLSAQLEHELLSEQADLEQEEERLRLGRLPLRERLVALRTSAEARVRCRLASGETMTVRLLTVGRDWMAGEAEGAGRAQQAVVPFTAIDALLLTPDQAALSLEPVAERSELGARLGIAFLLRDLCRRRAAVTVRTRSGEATGTIDRVGRDHFDLAEHDPDEPRRARAVTQVRVIPHDQVLIVSL
jgi:hypothetical protein